MKAPADKGNTYQEIHLGRAKLTHTRILLLIMVNVNGSITQVSHRDDDPVCSSHYANCSNSSMGDLDLNISQNPNRVCI